jgi:hypothetical protein
VAVILDDWRYRWMDGVEDRKARFNLSLEKHEQLRFRLYGKTIGHPSNPDGREVFVSAPVFFDEKTLALRTASGREYTLGKCGGADESEHVGYIRKDILRNKKYAPASKPKPEPVEVGGGNDETSVIDLNMGSEVDQAFGRGRPK